MQLDPTRGLTRHNVPPSHHRCNRDLNNQPAYQPSRQAAWDQRPYPIQCHLRGLYTHRSHLGVAFALLGLNLTLMLPHAFNPFH